MSDQKQENKPKEAPKETKRAKPPETKHYIYELREHSRELFGVKPEVLDGALFDYPDTQISKSEAERRIRAFLNKEAKQ
ncbi:hypothetical protein [Halalkalibacterium halodurans]|uniref:YqzN/YkzM domain-containing protein n=1 Tax=Halalkalibacterium halodurans TaxID=86665 RepID=A0A0M0KM01_ALKHA|nr:hypothetical protein [Halalkalibacterium halodurans]TPE70667.1 hypothetical protein AMD02_001485 [Halalkalibacterium halodurans]